MLTVYLNRGIEEHPCWDWCVEDEGGCGFLPVPYDPESGDYDISSATLQSALAEDGYDPETLHWAYIDSDFGPVGEWNRPEGVA